MKTDIMKASGKEISYLEIVRRGGDIKIPLIQRDYAQGRDIRKVAEIRDRFLKDLHSAIVEKKPLSLDFIYGVTDENRFIPLDGQQRLTTLFLISIYLDGLRGLQPDGLNFRFSYETRESSRIFCENIVAHRFDIFSEEMLGERKDADGKEYRLRPSSVIRNQSWWLNKWNADPTVDGMLRMLDAIDRTFFTDHAAAAANLFGSDTPLITFHFMNLDHYDDPDDLFIKMNARGLPLTEFEIFKGRWMEQIEAEYSGDEARKMKTDIDVYWTDFLWPMRRLREGLANTDPYFSNLLKLTIGDAAASIGIPDVDFEALFEANKKDLTFSYGKYVDEYGVVFDRKMLSRIAEALQEMCTIDSVFTRLRDGRIPTEGWLDLDSEWNYFVIRNDELRINPNYKGRMALYAAARFSHLMPHASDENAAEWTRLMRNLLDNTRIDDVKDAVKVIHDIDMMLTDLVDYRRTTEAGVNDWVARSAVDPNGLSKAQWQQEKVKAILRKDPQWNKEITEAERHRYLDGDLSPILRLSGLVGDNTPFVEAPLHRDIDVFREYKDKCISLFDEAGKNNSEVTSDFLLVRAMLSKGDYMPELTANRRNLYNNPGHRDYSWKALFRIDHSTAVGALEILKQVVDDPDFSPADVIGSLKAIIKNADTENMPLWRRMMVSEFAPEFLRFSRQGFIAFGQGNPANTLIYTASRGNGYNAALYALFAEALVRHLSPETDVTVSWPASLTEDYTLTINGKTWTYWDNEFSLEGECDGNEYNDGVIAIASLSEIKDFIRHVLQHPGNAREND